MTVAGIHASNGRKKDGRTDFRLVLRRLERDLVKGENTRRCRRILSRKVLWNRLDVGAQLDWARLAQLAGDVDTALAVLAHINKQTPDFLPAWESHLELLAILGHGTEAVPVLEAARGHLSPERYQDMVRLCAGREGAPDEDHIVEKAAGPFDRLRRRQETLVHYMSLFGGRRDCFARQWADKDKGRQGYVPMRRALEAQDVEDHLAGRKTYGIYLLDTDATVRTAVIDADLVRRFVGKKLGAEDRRMLWRERQYLISRINEVSAEAGLRPLAEFSGGKGYHFWYLFSRPVRAGFAKSLLEGITGALAGDLTAFTLEVFPKQAQLSGKGLGNLVKLPLGVHRLSGRQSFFLGCRDHAVQRQLDFLSTVKRDEVDKLKTRQGQKTAATLVIHPRFRQWAIKYPDLYALERSCPPLGQLIAACRGGHEVTLREEKVLYQTIGFLPARKTLVHHLMSQLSEYNPHMVDYRLSRLRGTPLGCRRIHSLLGYAGDFCRFETAARYPHPLLHLGQEGEEASCPAEKAQNLSAALENLEAALARVKRFIK